MPNHYVTGTHAPMFFVPEADRSLGPNPAAFLRGHRVRVEALDAHGIPAPAQWRALATRLDSLQAAVHGNVMLDKLTAAVLDGDGDIAEALALALAAQRPQQLETVLEHVWGAANAELGRLYGPVAAKNYRTIRDEFDGVAVGFAACCKVADVTAPAEQIVQADPKALHAWQDAETHAARLDALLPVLLASAELCRAPAAGYLGNDPDTLLIGLCIDTRKVARRALWHAWRNEDTPAPPGAMTSEALTATAVKAPPVRLGRWGRLARLGVTIRAADHPAGVPLFPPPKPWFVEFLPGGKRVSRDPEDATVS